jgi:hypothetical protein
MLDWIYMHPTISQWLLVSIPLCILLLALTTIKPESSNGRMQLGDED